MGSHTGPLTTSIASTTGDSGNNLFIANLSDNANTFQSGDSIDGGAGTDTLDATMASSPNFAVLASTTSVEVVNIQAQSTDANGSSGDNNVDNQTGQQVTIDAQRMVGVNEWHNTDSRADLVIEDVRILDSQITRDITIGWHEADPGSMGNKNDFEVYFSPLSLRKEGGVSTTDITLSISNPLSVADGFVAATPLLDLPYDSVRFNVDGVEQVIALDLTDVETYDDLWEVIEEAFTDAGFDITRALAAETFFARDGQVRNADVYTVSKTGSELTPATVGWTATGGLPSDNAFSANVSQGDTSSTSNLITSTVVLDNVGRESEAGNLIIGSMSTRTGVERFEVTVENNSIETGAYTNSGSWLSSMSSTNNVLEEVEVTRISGTVGADGLHDYLYVGSGMNEAGNNLVTERGAADLLNTDGLTDVRLFDADLMTGDVKVGASITANSIAKYQDLVDDAVVHGNDDVAFVYNTGAGNDSVNLQIDGSVAASNSSIVVGRHDFTFTVNGNAGDDHIQVALVDGLGNTNWYTNQSINDNVTINGGAGNDTIRTPGAGDTNINGGAGNDAIYTDNTGEMGGVTYNAGRAVWIFNTANGSKDIEDLTGDTAVANATNVINLDLNLTYGGYTSTVTIAGSVATTVNDLTINQAIKAAINNDEFLSDILIAEDGPGRSLIVRALQDGVDASTELVVQLETTAAATAGQTALGLSALSDAQAELLGFDANSVGDEAAGTFAAESDGETTNGTDRYLAELGQATQTTEYTAATATQGANAALEVQNLNTMIAGLTTEIGGGIDDDDFDAAGTLTISAGGSTYSVDVAAGDTVAATVAALNV